MKWARALRADRVVREEPAADPIAPLRTTADVFNALERVRDPAEALASAANPAERAFYAQADRETRKWHHYLAAYDRYLARFRGTAVRLLEIGVHNGGSLQVWRRYLGEAAVIHGLDLDPRCAAIDDADLTIHIGSQGDAALLAGVVDAMGGVDVVVDDGSHVWPHQVASFEALYPRLSDHGVYLCEDTHSSYWPAYGGGRPDSDSFVAYAKRLVDLIHAPYRLDRDGRPDDLAATVAQVSFYDSIVAIEKQPPRRPFHTSVGQRRVIV